MESNEERNKQDEFMMSVLNSDRYKIIEDKLKDDKTKMS